MKANKILGIDPGLDRTGWAVVQRSPAGFVLQAAGLIHTPPAAPLPERLDIIFKEIAKIAAQFAPQEAAMEEMFFMKRAASVSHTIQTRGVILLALHQSGLSVAGYQPKKVKLTLCGTGAADKKQMQRMVQLTLSLKDKLNPDDVADAAAIAICHLKTAPLASQINAKTAFLQKLQAAKAALKKN